MSTATKILSTTAIQIFGKAVTGALSIITIKAITGLEVFQQYSGLPADYRLIYTYLGFFGIMADFGLFTIAVREMSTAKNPEEQSFILGNIYGMRVFSIIAAIILASLVIFLLPFENYTWNVKIGVGVAAISTVLTMMASTASSILQVHLKMIQPTIALIVGKVIMTAYILVVVTNFDRIPHPFYQLLFAGIVGTLATYLLTIRHTKFHFPFVAQYHFPYWKKVFTEAFPYGLAIILSTMYFQIDVLLLSFFRDKNEIAIYGYPSTIIELLSIFPVYFMNSVFPTLSRAFAESQEQAKKICSLSFSFLAFITFPMVTGGIILGRPLMAFAMNEAFLTGNVQGFYGADLAFQLQIFPALFAFLNTLFTFTLIAGGNQAKLLRINGLAVAFTIITNLIFMPRYGFIAAGVITTFTEIIVLTLTFLACRKQIRIPFDFPTLGKLLGATVVMGVFLLLALNRLQVLPLVGLGALVYLACLIPLRVLPRELVKTP